MAYRNEKGIDAMENVTEIKDTVKKAVGGFFGREWTCTEKVLLLADCVLFGVVLGRSGLQRSIRQLQLEVITPEIVMMVMMKTSGLRMRNNE